MTPSITQRTRADQVRAARPALGAVARRVAVASLALAALGAAGAAYLAYARQPHLDPECAAAYARARTARDTALAGALQVGRRAPSLQACGTLRRLLEASAAGSRPGR